MNIETINEIKESVYILIYLDTLKENKSLKYHDIILQNISLFNQENIKVKIVTPDEQEYLDKIQNFYNSSIIYIGNPTKEYFFQNHLVKNKIIYGKNHIIIYPEIQVIADTKHIFKANRINNKTINMAYIKAFEEILKKIKIFLKKR